MEASRPALPRDLAIARELWDRAIASLSEARDGAVALSRETRTAAALGPEGAISSPGWHLELGTVSEVPVGLGVGHIEGGHIDRGHPEQGRSGSCRDGMGRWGVIDGLYVEPEAREVGVGTAILSGMGEWFRARSCATLDVPVLPGDRLTKSLFESCGMRARLVTMHARLDGHRLGPGRRAAVAERAGKGTAEPVPGRPELAVGAVTVSGDQLLLVRRANAPSAGSWSLPGGRVEAGERMTEAVEREVAEETGLRVSCGELVGFVEIVGAEGHFVVFDYMVTSGAGAQVIRAGDDAAEVAWFSAAAVAELAASGGLAEGLGDFLAGHGLIAGPGLPGPGPR